ncbi:MAG: hypothetical protein AAFS12_05400 [Cyanobacteria bacterium J06632_19]
MKGCGCKICNADLGDFTNDLVIAGESLKSVINSLKEQGLNVSIKLLKKHLNAFEIEYVDEKTIAQIEDCQPITIDLNQIDFSKYNFDVNQPETVIAYLQKLNLKVYLNQLQIVLQLQQNMIDGKSPEVPTDVLKNLAVAFQIFEKSTAMGILVNQKEAIRIVENLGLNVEPMLQLPPQNNVSNTPDSETNQ